MIYWWNEDFHKSLSVIKCRAIGEDTWKVCPIQRGFSEKKVRIKKRDKVIELSEIQCVNQRQKKSGRDKTSCNAYIKLKSVIGKSKCCIFKIVTPIGVCDSYFNSYLFCY